jgi:hypothetical protein
MLSSKKTPTNAATHIDNKSGDAISYCSPIQTALSGRPSRYSVVTSTVSTSNSYELTLKMHNSVPESNGKSALFQTRLTQPPISAANRRKPGRASEDQTRGVAFPLLFGTRATPSSFFYCPHNGLPLNLYRLFSILLVSPPFVCD